MSDSETGVCRCDSTVPALSVEKGHLGNWYVQVIYCESCATKLETLVHHQAEIHGVAELDDKALPEFKELLEE